MKPTPRTDAEADRFPQPGQPPGAQWPEIVPAEFARQLERDLESCRVSETALIGDLMTEREQVAILRSDIKRLEGFAKTYRLRADEAETQRDQEHQDRKQAMPDVCRALGERNDARAELATARDALEWARGELGKHTRPSPIDKALGLAAALPTHQNCAVENHAVVVSAMEAQAILKDCDHNWRHK